MAGVCGRRLGIVASVFRRGSACLRRWTGVLPTLTLLGVRAAASPVLEVLEQDGVGLVDLRAQCGGEGPLRRAGTRRTSMNFCCASSLSVV